MLSKVILLLVVSLSCLGHEVYSLVVNGYAKITAISGSTLTISNVDESGDSFEDGEYVIIMQMQDNVIGSNTANNVNFGNLSSIASAGLFEVKQILSHTESSGTPNAITLSSSLTNSYSTGANSSLQLISFPTLGSPNFTTTASLTAKNWDGNTGGVLAINIDGTFTISHNISANNAGFRGGSRSANYYSGGTACNTSNYIRTSNHTRAGEKGEGIYKSTNTNFNYSNGKILNGGGGGNERINSGGGGGGNYSAGGLGGLGWSCTAPGGGGLGGIDLSTHIAGNRVFMGGGGGGGQQNNSNSTDGGDGSGIIIIKAQTVTSLCGGSITISANGQTASNASNDGQGGGGAGGSIILDVDNWTIPASCPLTVSANGGNGGNSTSGTQHAGGGQGTIIYNIASPTTNTTNQTLNGNGGANCASCGSAASGTGSNNSGVQGNVTGSLPIELTEFSIERININDVRLIWQTQSEYDNDFFTIERSFDGIAFKPILVVPSNGNSSYKQNYSAYDFNLRNGIVYYRLKQTDFDGHFKYYPPQSVFIDETNLTEKFRIYPNPVNDYLKIDIPHGIDGSIAQFSIINVQGQIIKTYAVNSATTKNLFSLDVSLLPKGVYVIKYLGENKKFTKL